ncbi:MAG: hypothetical protein U5K84_03515 [Alkalibacterium sp.]|nr:hypothetical protein [Alkalibacterium sp.]
MPGFLPSRSTVRVKAERSSRRLVASVDKRRRGEMAAQRIIDLSRRRRSDGPAGRRAGSFRQRVSVEKGFMNVAEDGLERCWTVRRLTSTVQKD